jgi:hypothetical protein
VILSIERLGDHAGVVSVVFMPQTLKGETRVSWNSSPVTLPAPEPFTDKDAILVQDRRDQSSP